MKNIKTKILRGISVILIVAMSCFITSCSEKSDDSIATNSNDSTYSQTDTLKLYDIKNSYSIINYYVDDYNKYCEENYDDSYKIEIVEFDNEDEMLTRMSAELMAGEGPDFISLSTALPFEKLIKQGVFADLNELMSQDTSNDKLNLDDYNSVVMDSGVYDGKRYFVPINYTVNMLVSTKELCDKFNIPTDTKLTYDNFSSAFTDFLANPGTMTSLETSEEKQRIMFKFINDYIDLYNNTTSFNSSEFRQELESLKKVLDKAGTTEEIHGLEQKDCLMYYNIYGTYDSCQLYADYTELKQEPILFNDVSKDGNATRALIEMGLAISQNSDKKDKAFAFVKYLLSPEVQGDLAAVDLKKYEGVMSANIDYGFPVHKDTFNQLIENAGNLTYGDGAVKGIDNSFMQSYFEIVKNVNTCDLKYMYYNYYNNKIIADVLDDYLSGQINAEQFISELTQKTEIYMNE